MPFHVFYIFFETVWGVSFVSMMHAMVTYNFGSERRQLNLLSIIIIGSPEKKVLRVQRPWNRSIDLRQKPIDTFNAN